MAAHDKAYERGSEWRKWDLHIHTPASFHWKGAKFEADPASAANRALVDAMIAALNAAEPAVFALMDYWTFDGWLALKRRLGETGAPTLTKTVFPGIELSVISQFDGLMITFGDGSLCHVGGSEAPQKGPIPLIRGKSTTTGVPVRTKRATRSRLRH